MEKIKCKCGWAGLLKTAKEKMWCWLCPKCSLVIKHKGGQIKLSMNLKKKNDSKKGE